MERQERLAKELEAVKRRLQILEDKEAIRDLLTKLAFNLDLNRNDAYVKFYTEDGVFTHSPDGVLKGRDQIKQFLLTSVHQPVTNNSQHLFLSFKIDVDGDSATAAGYVLVTMRWYGGLGIARCAMRTFSFQRVKGRWLIKESASIEIGNPKCHQLISPDE